MAKYPFLKHYRGAPAARGSATTVRAGPPETDGPFAETKELIAGFMIIDGDSDGRALAVGGGYAAGEWMKTIGTKVGTVLCGA
ncbi:YciI family protein [Mycolicibacterium baixiangningiae]|uniref:YciI family protein n=1 Tax=Mycolicibacterium baixiangningiae TaxID=2761578 RepID=UPI0018CFEF02|nr:YciI family protein [Mycolicibacterium baixiangningiae]